MLDFQKKFLQWSSSRRVLRITQTCNSRVTTKEIYQQIKF